MLVCNKPFESFFLNSSIVENITSIGEVHDKKECILKTSCVCAIGRLITDILEGQVIWEEFFFFGLRDIEGKDAMIIQNVMNYLCSDRIYCEANEA